MFDIPSICSGLHLARDGIWYAAEKQEISYPDKGNQDCFAVEDNSFWFQHRNNCINALIQSYPPKDGGPIFDIGGGNGYVSQSITKSGFDVVLVEPGYNGARNAKVRGIDQIICASFEDAQFSPKTIPAIGLFDVLEHIKDDLSFLKSINSLLITEGRLYLTVPAYSFLWSNEDDAAGHYRRYTMKAISEKLSFAGFKIEFATYMFRLLPLPIFLFRTLPSKFGLKDRANKNYIGRDHVAENNKLRRTLDTALSSEVRNIRKRSPMRFGASCLISAATQ